ncbi:MAG: sulfatase-like hydrolase/transferase [Pirellulaceae bacterium]|nr:sulfatase-like hydrolase/transferase [Pirellulaceae bacterium]
MFSKIARRYRCAAASVTCLVLFSSFAEADDRPNLLIVLADDLGYGDLACYGHPVIETPNLDRFASESLRLTDCYAAAANCSPSRTGLMTGRTPYRVGVQNWIPMFSPMHVRRNEITVATLLRDAGYSTCQTGKWHLNGRFNLPDQPQPHDHGFDHWFATQNNALPTHHNPENFVRNGESVGRLDGFSAQLVADEAIGWLEEGRDATKPFFLFVCFHEPHEPIATHKRFMDLYPGEASRARHHGNVTQMDHAFGRLMKSLEDLKLTESTFVFFTSDNGPAITRSHPHGSAGPLRAKKGDLYDGGIRVPGMVRWPGVTQPGSTSGTPISGVDLLPTLCELAQTEKPDDRVLDGTSFAPLLRGQQVVRERPLYWQYNWARSEPTVALRDGDWKILGKLSGAPYRPGAAINTEEQAAIKTAELTGYEIYNLSNDVGETTDLSEKEPAQLARLAKLLEAYYHEVRNEAPTWPQWKWPRYEGKRIGAFYRQQRAQQSSSP